MPGQGGDTATASPRPWLVYLLLAAGLVGGLLTVEHLQNGEACPPLDDAFIHFQYARSLAEGHPFNYAVPGEYSSGASSLLWPILLAPGWFAGLHGMGLYLWALLLSVGCWAAAAEQVRRLLAAPCDAVAVAVPGLNYYSRIFARSATIRRVVVQRGCGGDLPRLPARPALWNTAFLGGLTVIASGPLLWGAASGMEVSLMALATVGFLRALLRDDAPTGARRTIGWGLLLSAVRPEGALVVAVLSGWDALGRRRWPWRVVLAAPGALLPALNLWFTGTVVSGSVAAKANPRWFHVSEYSQIGVLWENYVVGGYGDAFFGAAGLAVLILFGVGLAGWGPGGAPVGEALGAGQIGASNGPTRAWARDRRVALALVWLLPMCLDVWVMRRPTQGARYLMPGLVLFLPMAFLGAKKAGVLLGGARWPSWVLGALLMAQLGTWGQRLVADSAEILAMEVATARFVAEQLPAGKIVAGNDVGALGYFGGHRLLDLEGLVSTDALPYALDGRAGEFHLIASEKPDMLVIFPTWFPGFVENGLVDVLASVSVTDPKAVGAAVVVIARPVPAAFASRAVPPMLQDEERVLDSLDEGDWVEEQAHAWSDEAGSDGGQPARGWFGAGQLDRGRRSEIVRAEWAADEAGPVIDSLRRHESHESFTLTGTSHRARLVGRLGPSSSPQSLRITWSTVHNGAGETGTREAVLPVITGWYTLDLELGAVDGATTVTVARQTGLGGVTGGFAAAHWWLLG